MICISLQNQIIIIAWNWLNTIGLLIHYNITLNRSQLLVFGTKKRIKIVIFLAFNANCSTKYAILSILTSQKRTKRTLPSLKKKIKFLIYLSSCFTARMKMPMICTFSQLATITRILYSINWTSTKLRSKNRKIKMKTSILRFLLNQGARFRATGKLP